MEIAAPPHWQTADFISDLHLQASEPQTLAGLEHYLAHTPAQALFILGDLFEVWVGDDALQSPIGIEHAVADLLHRASARLDVFIMCGNRDFLMGEALTAGLGANLLPEQVLVTIAGRTMLLSHGDEYCTDDVAYQQFRTMVRNPAWQSGFLAKSIPERLTLAAQARGESMVANQTKSSEIMDVNADAVAAAIRAHNVSLIVHGHTHRPGRNVLTVDGNRCERWVLPDWDCDVSEDNRKPRGGWMVIDEDGLTLFDLTPR